MEHHYKSYRQLIKRQILTVLVTRLLKQLTAQYLKNAWYALPSITEPHPNRVLLNQHQSSLHRCLQQLNTMLGTDTDNMSEVLNMKPSTTISGFIETDRVRRARRNKIAVRNISIAALLVLFGYCVFYITTYLNHPWLALAIFIAGYLTAWIKHGRLFQRIIKTKDYMHNCGYTLRTAWRRAGMVLN